MTNAQLIAITVLLMAFVVIPLAGLLREGTVEAAARYWVKGFFAPVAAGSLLAILILLYKHL